MSKGFEYNSHFNIDSSFTSLKFGYDRPILETELNELQDIQNHNRKLLVNKICKSGIVELVDKDFNGDSIVFNPNNELNKIAIAPMKIIVNGYEVHVCGNYKIGEDSTYIDIDLNEAPDGEREETKFRSDLVFLQVWLEEFNGNDNMKRYGHEDGTTIPNTIVDVRVGSETSRRMLLKWKIRTTNILSKNLNYDRWEYGFGFDNTGAGNFVRIESDVVKNINIYDNNFDKIFANATHYMFKGCTFYGDNNLWVAGRPDRIDPSNTKDTSFVYAIPLFKIDRRNKLKFSIDNPNGSNCFEEQNVSLRPDNKCYDQVYKEDIIDLRKTVIVGDNEIQQRLNNTLKLLFDGNLITKYNSKMKRMQFGIEPLSKEVSSCIFLESFNKGFNGMPMPEVGTTPTINPPTKTVKYLPSVTEFGVDINKYNLQYSMSSITKFNNDEGTIEFFISPNWNGFDNVEQDILTINYLSVGSDYTSPFLTIKKVNSYNSKKEFVESKLVIKRYLDSNGKEFNIMNVGINNVLRDKIYHVRICWSVAANQFNCYLNGNIVGNSLDAEINEAINRPINDMIIGNNDINVDSSFVIDELIIYNESLSNKNWNIPKDFIEGNALILPSFNGTTRNYKGNICSQDDLVQYVVTKTGDRSITINSPYGTVVGSTTPKIYCLKRASSSPAAVLEGMELQGNWTGIGTESLIFNLSGSISQFSGETVAIVYSITMDGKNNISDIPDKILKSEIYDSKNNVIKNVSFNVENKSNKVSAAREVSKLVTIARDENGNEVYEPVRHVYNAHDTAYDFSTYRKKSTDSFDKEDEQDISNDDYAFARLLEFYIEGNNTDTYVINRNLYGNDIGYIKQAEMLISDTNGFEVCKKINLKAVELEQDKVIVRLSKVVMSGIKIKFEIGLCGVAFDYNTNSKSYVSNTSKAYLLEFTSTGNDYEYLIPLNELKTQIGSNGVIKAIAKQHSYEINEYDDVIKENEMKYICYNNGIQQEYELLDGLDKPFIKINIRQVSEGGTVGRVPVGNKISIPVFVTYQLSSNDIMSIWYDNTQFQGVLDSKINKVKRLSDWKYFITTLSSGGNDKQDKKNALSNLVNRLPGGISASSNITSQDINLKGHYPSKLLNDDYNVNNKLIFTNETYIGEIEDSKENNFFELETEYNISKSFGKIQDDNINFADYRISLPSNNDLDLINRYCGMACVVINDYGDLYLLVIGDTNGNVPTDNNYIKPTFGDLFVIPNRPGLPSKS